MRSYEEIDEMDKPVGLIEFIVTMTAIVSMSAAFAWVFVYLMLWIFTLVSR